MRRYIRMAAFLIATAILLAAGTVGAAAQIQAQDMPTDTYTYWQVGSARKLVPSRPMYTAVKSISGNDLGLGAFSQPKDVFIDQQGKGYLMDSGNARVIILDDALNLIKVMDTFTFQDELLDITGANGLFVDSDGRLYIADTEHARVLICDEDGAVEQLLTLPESELIPDDFNFRPMKVLADRKGYIYIISQGSYYGAVTFAADHTFGGFFGANTIRAGVKDILGRLIDRLFSNDIKRGASIQALPYQFTDFCADGKDFIYTSTGMVSAWGVSPGQIKKLSPGGINILKTKFGRSVRGADSFDFGDVGVSYGKKNMKRIQDFCGLDVDDNGFLYTIDSTYGRIFLYDRECNLLNAFGGGVGQGTQLGTFEIPSAIAVDPSGQRLLVTDMNRLTLTLFEETEYGSQAKRARTFTMDGDYESAKPLWEDVLRSDRNNQQALRSLAEASLLEKDFYKAMEYARLGFDQDTYAQAFVAIRNEYMSNNFWWMLLLLAGATGAFAIFLVLKKRRGWVLIKAGSTRVMLRSVFHPFDSFTKVKDLRQGSMRLASGLLILYFVVTVLSQMYGGFMYGILDKSNYNALFALGKTVGLALLWTVVNWATGTLFEGKGRWKEIFIVTCYSLIPQVINQLVYLIVSHTLAPQEAMILQAVSVICTGASLFVLCVGIMTVHEFGFFKFLGISAITLIGMGLVIFIIFLIGILLQQLVVFITTLILEAAYR